MFNPSTDLSIIADGTETLALLRRDAPAGEPGTTIDGALRLAVVRREPIVGNRYEVRRQVDTFGRFTAADVVWRLPAGSLPLAPELGDVLLDTAGRRWTILEVEQPPLPTCWRCTARDLALAYSLDDCIAVLRPVYAKGAGGAAEATWVPWRTGVRAHIQTIRDAPTTEHGARRTARRVRILLAENLAFTAMHRVRGPDGALYRIVAIAGRERLGEPQTIEAETL